MNSANYANYRNCEFEFRYMINIVLNFCTVLSTLIQANEPFEWHREGNRFQ